MEVKLEVPVGKELLLKITHFRLMTDDFAFTVVLKGALTARQGSLGTNRTPTVESFVKKGRYKKISSLNHIILKHIKTSMF